MKLNHLHMHQVRLSSPSKLSQLYRSLNSQVIALLPNSTFTSPILSNLCLPSGRPPLKSAINTLLVIRYSPILSTCSNHINILSHSLSTRQLSFYTGFSTHLVIPKSVNSRPSLLLSQTLHREHAIFSQHFIAPCLCIKNMLSSFSTLIPQHAIFSQHFNTPTCYLLSAL